MQTKPVTKDEIADEFHEQFEAERLEFKRMLPDRIFEEAPNHTQFAVKKALGAEPLEIYRRLGPGLHRVFMDESPEIAAKQLFEKHTERLNSRAAASVRLKATFKFGQPRPLFEETKRTPNIPQLLEDAANTLWSPAALIWTVREVADLSRAEFCERVGILTKQYKGSTRTPTLKRWETEDGAPGRKYSKALRAVAAEIREVQDGI